MGELIDIKARFERELLTNLMETVLAISEVMIKDKPDSDELASTLKHLSGPSESTLVDPIFDLSEDKNWNYLTELLGAAREVRGTTLNRVGQETSITQQAAKRLDEALAPYEKVEV